MATIKSIKEKAKAYDEAIEKIQKYVKDDYGCTRLRPEDIFPELKEDKGKRMIRYFKDLAPFDKADELYEKYGFSHKDAIAWLEKQGEHANFLSKIQVGDKVTMNEDGVLVNLTSLNRVVNKGIENAIKAKQGEKPRYSIGDVLCDKSCTTLNKDTQPNFEIVDIRNGLYICDKGSFPISQQDNYELVAKKIEQNLAWSDEDEAVLDALIRTLEGEEDIFVAPYLAVKCLKSLKDRVQQQSTWKPSDEQIKTLENVRKILHSKGIYSKANSLMYNFEELIRTITKLKE